MRKALLLLYIYCLALSAHAIPAITTPIQAKQKDGSTVTLYLLGDERFHYFITADNYPVIQSEDLSYYYSIMQDSTLVSSGVLAHNANERSNVENELIRNNRESVLALITYKQEQLRKTVTHRQKRANALAASRLLGEPTSYIGTKKGLVLLVNFTDISMRGTNPNENFNNFFNQVGYCENNHIGSVHDYFYDQSYGLFDLQFDVIGPVTVSKQCSYYGSNGMWSSQTDIHVQDMVTEACQLVDDKVDFSQYDWDGDGTVDQIFIIYAGYGEASSGLEYTIWPHESDLKNPLVLDGVTIQQYACSCELYGSAGSNPNGIGTACHEFSHCLGIPDFYNVYYTGGFNMNYWDLMDYGSYSGVNKRGEVPCGFSAYERWLAGWLDFTELTETSRIKDMPNLGDEAVAYKIVNDNNPDEYFVLENRQSKGWFSYVSQYTDIHGLLITHIDYDEQMWQRDAVNTQPNHPRMAVVPADNSYGQITTGTKVNYVPSEEELRGDLFPGSDNVTEFTNTSHYNMGGKLFTANTDSTYYINKPVTNIKEDAGYICFDFMGGIYVPTPVINEITLLANNSFSLSWQGDTPIDYYVVEATEVRKKYAFENILLTEDFSNFTNTEEEGFGINDLSTYMNHFTQTKGWEGNNIYSSPYGARMYAEKDSGYLQTPFINVSDTGLTLKITTQAEEVENSMLTIYLLDENNIAIDSTKVFVSTESHSIVVNFNQLNAKEYKLKIIANAVVYIKKLVVYDGTYAASDLSISASLLIKPTEKLVVENISETSHVFNNLNASKYNVRVKAVYDEASSAWTDYVQVDLSRYNAIQSPSAKTSSSHTLYNLNGQKVNNTRKPGIYIIDNSQKRIIR